MKQIQAKERKNRELQESIIELKEELQTSKEDFNIIVQYLNRKKNREIRGVGLKGSKVENGCHLDSTKDSGKIEKDISGVKQTKLTGSGSNINNYKVRPTRQIKSGNKLRKNKSDLFDL